MKQHSQLLAASWVDVFVVLVEETKYVVKDRAEVVAVDCGFVVFLTEVFGIDSEAAALDVD